MADSDDDEEDDEDGSSSGSERPEGDLGSNCEDDSVIAKSTGSNGSSYGYHGSAARVGRGLVSRTDQHLDEQYRKMYLSKLPNYYHYLR